MHALQLGVLGSHVVNILKLWHANLKHTVHLGGNKPKTRLGLDGGTWPVYVRREVVFVERISCLCLTNYMINLFVFWHFLIL